MIILFQLKEKEKSNVKIVSSDLKKWKDTSETVVYQSNQTDDSMCYFFAFLFSHR